MNWTQIEKMFDRSWMHVSCKSKLLLLFPLLSVSGLLIIFGKALSMAASPWMSMSLTFFPVFLSSGLLLAGGVVLTRAYQQELKQSSYNFKNIFQSWQILINISYLSFPLVLAYLILWIAMACFYFLKALPGIGPFIGAILAFAPFLLVTGAILLGLFNLVVLFFVTPEAALKTGVKLKLLEAVCARLKQGVFFNLLSFVIGTTPLILSTIILYFAAKITGASFFIGIEPLSMLFHWFFIMIPFAALLSPSVIFFFNFATECFYLYQLKEKKALLEEPVHDR